MEIGGRGEKKRGWMVRVAVKRTKEERDKMRRTQDIRKIGEEKREDRQNM